MEALEGEQDYDEFSLHGDKDVDILDGIEIILTVASDYGTVDDNITAGKKGPTEPIFVPIKEEILVKFSVAQLKAELKLRSQKVTGMKNKGLQELLRKVLDDKVPNKVDEALSEKKKETQRGDGLQHFASTARWTVFTLEETPVEEPLNPRFKNSRAPTIPEEDSKHILVKA